MRIIFMGTPDFAVESLKALVENKYNVVAVVTMPDKPAGRGHHLQQSPVKQYALSAGLPVMQPERLKDEQFLNQLRSYNADLQIVVAFRMLPEAVWAMPPLGTFNLHASLLPQYRGAAPVNWAVINGEKITGATTFLLKHEIDTGDILMQRTMQIDDDDDAGTLHDKLMVMGAKMVTDTVDLIASGNYTPLPQQQQAELRPAPKIFRETCEIDWSMSAQRVHDFVRGLSPYPAAWTMMHIAGMTEMVKVFKTEITAIERNQKTKPGETVINSNEKTILVACQDYYIRLNEIQRPGKRRMTTKEALNGIR